MGCVYIVTRSYHWNVVVASFHELGGQNSYTILAWGSFVSSVGMIVPSSAIITEGSDTYVLKSDGKTNVLTKVETGIADADGNTQIISGLQEGDKVAAFGISNIK